MTFEQSWPSVRRLQACGAAVLTIAYLMTAIRHRAYAWLPSVIRQRTLALDPP